MSWALCRAQTSHQHAQDFFMPGHRETPARAVVGNFQIVHAIGPKLGDLEVKPLTPHHQVRQRLRVAKINLVDDGQHRNLKQYGVQPGAADGDVDLARGQRADADVFFVELEQAQKVNKITLDEAQRLQIGQLGVLEMQTAQGTDFVADLA